MSYFKIFAFVGGLLLLSTPSLASNYSDFQRDLAIPYGHYRQALMLTSKKDNADQAKLTVEQFIKDWESLSKRYSADIPTPFVAVSDFSSKLQRPVTIGHEAIRLINEGQVSNAHAVLEEVRYLLWGMRIQGRLNSVADKSNDFHEAMEVVMDQAAAAHSAEELTAIAQRYGAWLIIKWEDQALADDLTSIREKFDPALVEGRPVIKAYLDALLAGDSVASKKLTASVKNAYKKIWLLDPK